MRGGCVRANMVLALALLVFGKVLRRQQVVGHRDGGNSIRMITARATNCVHRPSSSRGVRHIHSHDISVTSTIQARLSVNSMNYHFPTRVQLEITFQQQNRADLELMVRSAKLNRQRR